LRSPDGKQGRQRLGRACVGCPAGGRLPARGGADRGGRGARRARLRRHRPRPRRRAAPPQAGARPGERLPGARAARAPRPRAARGGERRRRRLRAHRAGGRPPPSRDLPPLRPHGSLRGLLARASDRQALERDQLRGHRPRRRPARYLRALRMNLRQEPQAPDERAAAGKEARAAAPRSSHGEWAAAPGRPDPVELLEGQATSRVGQLVPLRYGRMLVSPFTFYRGAAAVMAVDLAATPRSGFEVQLCGDAHLSNFGAYASPDRELVFDVNDFDETLRGPWEWDVERLAASFSVAGRERGFGSRQRRGLVAAMAAEYRQAMRRLAEIGNLEVWYTKMDVSTISARWGAAAGEKEAKAFRRGIAKAQAKDRMRALSKLTREVDGKLRIVSEPPRIVPLDELVDEDPGRIEARVLEILDGYRETLAEDRRILLDGYRFADAALKVVGVGSVGTRAWVVLLLGRDEGDPLFLQVKEAQASVFEPHAAPSPYANQGERVVQGQRLVQAVSDIMLGWVRVEGVDGE